METVPFDTTNKAIPDFASPVLQADASGIYHPTIESDIQLLIAEARKAKVQIRVVGAAQSRANAIYTDNYLKNPQSADINIMLDGFRSLSYNEALMQVTVGAGINLGFNPFDPTDTSTKDNGLYPQLHAKGWAIANVSDAIHQTVAGFISTGSSGGSPIHSFDDAILSFRIIDGNGNISDINRSDDPDNRFYAVGSSLGLLGIIVSVTLQCVPTFDIIGTETTSNAVDTEMDFFGAGAGDKLSLQAYLSNTEFARILWWPIKSLQRCISWKARTMQASDYNPQTGTQEDFHAKPYEPVFPKLLGSRLPSEEFASIGFKLIATWPGWLYNLFGTNTTDKIIVDIVNKIEPHLYPLLIDMYFPNNSAKKPPQEFWDTWIGSLPMDTIEFSNNLFNLKYTELWIPIEKTQKTIDVLQQFYTEGGYAATGYYTVEILTAKRSSFWMSPSYQHDVVRINIMRFDDGEENNMAYFQQFWDLLHQKEIDFRLHWGKYLPPPASSTGSAYLQTQYPKWNDFMALRTTMDPDNIFLNSYWKTQLGIG